EEACLVVQTLDGAPPQSLACGGYGWRYAPTGHVLYLHHGALFALPFDATRPNSKITGTAVPILQDVAGADQSGAAHFSLSGTGTLAYLPSAGPPPGSGIELLDRSGKTTPAAHAPAELAVTAVLAGRQPDCDGCRESVCYLGVRRRT